MQTYAPYCGYRNRVRSDQEVDCGSMGYCGKGRNVNTLLDP